MTDCEHKFVYQGAVTWPDSQPRPGSGAHGRIYADAYFCEKCCLVRITNERAMGNTYEKVRNNAVEYQRRPA